MHYGLSPIEKGKLRILQNEYLGPHVQLSILKYLGETIWSVSLSFIYLVRDEWLQEGNILKWILLVILAVAVEDQLNVSLKSDCKYFRTYFHTKMVKKIFVWYLPHRGGLWQKCYFLLFFLAQADWPAHKFQICQTRPSCFLQITSQIFDIYDKN